MVAFWREILQWLSRGTRTAIRVKIDWGIKKQTNKQASKQLWFAIFIFFKRIITAFGITSDSSPHTIKNFWFFWTHPGCWVSHANPYNSRGIMVMIGIIHHVSFPSYVFAQHAIVVGLQLLVCPPPPPGSCSCFSVSFSLALSPCRTASCASAERYQCPCC